MPPPAELPGGPDLNCDLGEGEPPEVTRRLLAGVTSASIACGGHAGDLASMGTVLRMAAELGVRAGAHPGLPARESFGRATPAAVSESDLASWVRTQAGVLDTLARAQGSRLHHVKLHGALYHAVEADARLAHVFVETVRALNPAWVVFGRLGGEVLKAAALSGVEAWGEAFLDRAYRDDGTLVPRSEPGAVLHDRDAVLERLRLFRQRGGWPSVSGRWLVISARTLCVHGDSPGAADVLEALRDELRRSSS